MIKIFEKDGKTNFVDDRNLVVGYSTERDCCEDFGWFITPNSNLNLNINCDLFHKTYLKII